jgi:hypothetical protein
VTAAKYDLLLRQGDSFTLVFRIREKVWDPITSTYIPGDYKDLTGLFAKAQIRATAASSTVLAEFTATIPDQAVTLNRGTVVLKLTPTQTTALPPSAGYPNASMVWDVQLSDNAVEASANWRKTYLAGGVAMEAEVTR